MYGTARCVQHATDPAIRESARESARAGGRARAGQLTAPTAAPLLADIADLDLTTAVGLASYVAVALRRLAELPFDVRVGNSVAQLVGCQRAVVDASEFERRLTELEQQAELRRVA
jgi:hypothetical protein